MCFKATGRTSGRSVPFSKPILTSPPNCRVSTSSTWARPSSAVPVFSPAQRCDYYESRESIEANKQAKRPRIGVGINAKIENAIIDKNARIGDNVIISPAGKPENVDHPLYFIRDGIVIIPKSGILPDGTVI